MGFQVEDVVAVQEWIEVSAAFDGIPVGSIGTVVAVEHDAHPHGVVVTVRMSDDFEFLDDNKVVLADYNGDDPDALLRVLTPEEVEDALIAERETAGQ